MDEETIVVKSHDVHLDSEYREWLSEVKRRYRVAQVKSAIKVNSEQLLFNWQLGRDLVNKRIEEKWGKGVVEQVSLDLQEAFPGVKGFGLTNLWYMKRWYIFYSKSKETVILSKRIEEQFENTEKLHQVGKEIFDPKLHQVGEEMPFPPIFAYVPWRHHVDIMVKSKTVDEAFFYIQKTIENGWSRRALEDNMEANLYNLAGKAVTNFESKLPVPQGNLAQELLKGNYDLGFISLPEGYDERELEDAIERKITQFLLQLGDGWAFVGRQREIVIAGSPRKIDLLFYHIYLRCYVVIELKVKPFNPEFAGKLNFYVNAVDTFIRRESDNPTIGLLICKSMKSTEVQLAFQGITTPMGVATYNNVRVKEIQERLPTMEQFMAVIDAAETEYLENQKGKECDQ